ncbi:aminotransferase class III-fold pyridoxal phosphate-dependent enzyme [Neolewinella lacunae]|uniref:Aminotransferase class III-fold pyridoxal phosphate-dependent enzyme n=1 Tax=Neolewinella lacunae TaxID=1517758 RepID=A0A923PJX7_9BACT|nr:aminotransferase class III-fold pyridoxal phosphate-dependent enzyme [Neolewinella lacunae]MBC6994709.1 aminotransferase class III-fold pyridoxal phosphate-dependent enzyme [Neolewinella lacunae]MDN3634581.1 aminotransferase class III-fold pyridoxal phosphate-dependent enzyme [Neolewinella lacunae]
MSPTFSSERAAALAREHYGIDATEVKALAGEVDLNFYLRTTTGAAYTLKISAPDTALSSLEFQDAIMRHLADSGIPRQTPVPVGNITPLGGGRFLRLQTWIEGKMLGDQHPITASLRWQWGQTAGLLSHALQNFQHPAAPTRYKWNPSQTLDAQVLAQYLTEEERSLAQFFWARFATHTLPRLADLRQSINYNDAHEQNLLVDAHGRITGVIDFGDAMHTHTVNELAIACAYAGMGWPDPIGAMAEVVAGYHASFPLQPEELLVLLDLIIARLLLTVTTAAENLAHAPENPYLQVSAAPAWALLRRLRKIDPAFALAMFRAATGAESSRQFAPLHPVVRLAGKTVVPIDLSVGSLDLGNHRNYTDLPTFTRHVARFLEDRNADFAVGGYGEARPVYTTDAYATEGNYGPRWRTTHLGLDVWGAAGTPVFAPFPGVVHSLAIDPAPGSYGPTIILEHQDQDGVFYTLYGHLSADSLLPFRAGAQVQAGDEIARFGKAGENGGWPPHLHFQVMTDLLGYVGDFPGVAYPTEAAAWMLLCPDPSAFLGPAISARATAQPALETLLSTRRRALGYSLSVSYQQPLHIVRGAGQYLYDVSGRRYLDTVNNVAHVGHQHPRVVEAVARQAAVLNTNTRYLHEEILRFAEELVATLPRELSVVHFVNSGSEANELALRMCENWSGTRNMLALEVGYHGNTGRTIDVSHYKFNGNGGQGAPPQTRILPMPDVFRGRHRNPATAGRDYAAYARQEIERAEGEGRRFGGFIAESILSCGGQIPLPEGYLREVYGYVRAHGGLCISDEVQVGVGRMGTHWWGFELQGVIPDIVTIGKPLGNGHPLGAVVCTPEVAANFANGMEYFNTFGGNAVSCAAGRAVLRVVREEGLMENAQATGQLLQTLLRQLAAEFPLIGDVRGQGLFLGFELVYPDLAPAAAPAKYLKDRMRELGFLLSTDGPDDNVLKIKPPLCFNAANAAQLTDYLQKVLGEDACKI